MLKTNFNKSSRIVNSKDEIANTWNHHYQVSQDQQAMKVVDQSQLVEKFKKISSGSNLIGQRNSKLIL